MQLKKKQKKQRTCVYVWTAYKVTQLNVVTRDRTASRSYNSLVKRKLTQRQPHANEKGGKKDKQKKKKKKKTKYEQEKNRFRNASKGNACIF